MHAQTDDKHIVISTANSCPYWMGGWVVGWVGRCVCGYEVSFSSVGFNGSLVVHD